MVVLARYLVLGDDPATLPQVCQATTWGSCLAGHDHFHHGAAAGALEHLLDFTDLLWFHSFSFMVAVTSTNPPD